MPSSQHDGDFLVLFVYTRTKSLYRIKNFVVGKAILQFLIMDQ